MVSEDGVETHQQAQDDKVRVCKTKRGITSSPTMIRTLLLLAAFAVSALSPAQAQDANPTTPSAEIQAAPADESPAERPVTLEAPPPEVSEPEGVSIWPLLIGVLLLASLAGAGAAFFLQRRGQAQGGSTRRRSSATVPTGRELNPSGTVPGRTPLPSATTPDPLEPRVAALERQVADLTRAAAQPAPTAAPVQTPSAPTAAPPTPAAPQSPTDRVADLFVQWCQTRGGLVSRRELFAADVASAVPGASVDAVYRDLDTPARPIRFDGKGGMSPAEYWLVRVGGDRVLLPQPQGPGQFRDLAPVFDGSATPGTVGSVTPATVREEGGAFVLDRPGRVA